MKSNKFYEILAQEFEISQAVMSSNEYIAYTFISKLRLTS